MNSRLPTKLYENAPLGPAPMHPSYKLEEAPHPAQVAAFQRLSTAEKFERLVEMYRTAVAIKASQLRKQHPDWDESRIEHEARLAVMYGPD
jgi:hypothetical protein